MSEKADEFKEKAESLWKSGPFGKIVLTFVLLFMGPPGWIVIACLWGYQIYKISKK